MCHNFGLAWVPLSVTILLPLTFITTYTIAVLDGHVDAEFPYISDTGTKSPESCIFGQFLNISAVLIGICMYLRYRQVQDHNTIENVYSDSSSRMLQRLNKVTLCLGCLAALGISMVGNFQETNVIYVHLLGALLAFGLGTVYCWIQTVMSYSLSHMTKRSISHFRVFICIMATVSFISTFVAAYVAAAISGHKTADTSWSPDEPVMDNLAKSQYHGDDPRKWYPRDGGFAPHVVSTASEWIMAFAILLYFITFIIDFKGMTASHPDICYVVIGPRVARDDADDVLIS